MVHVRCPMDTYSHEWKHLCPLETYTQKTKTKTKGNVYNPCFPSCTWDVLWIFSGTTFSERGPPSLTFSNVWKKSNSFFNEKKKRKKNNELVLDSWIEIRQLAVWKGESFTWKTQSKEPHTEPHQIRTTHGAKKYLWGTVDRCFFLPCTLILGTPFC